MPVSLMTAVLNTLDESDPVESRQIKVDISREQQYPLSIKKARLRAEFRADSLPARSYIESPQSTIRFHVTDSLLAFTTGM